MIRCFASWEAYIELPVTDANSEVAKMLRMVNLAELVILESVLEKRNKLTPEHHDILESSSSLSKLLGQVEVGIIIAQRSDAAEEVSSRKRCEALLLIAMERKSR